MTSLFDTARLTDITLKNLAVEIALEKRQSKETYDSLPVPFDTMLVERRDDYDRFNKIHGSLVLISRLYNNIQDNHQKAFY